MISNQEIPYSVKSAGEMILRATRRVLELSHLRNKSDEWFDAKLESVGRAVMETAPRWYPKLYPVHIQEKFRNPQQQQSIES